MKNLKNYFLTAALTGIFLTGCKKDDIEVELIVRADAITEQIQVGEVVKYAAIFYVYSNKELKSATVKTPDDDVLTLVVATADKKQFVYRPDIAVYSDVKPEVGDYEFTITDKKDEVVIVKDKITHVSLPVVNITGTSFNNGKLKIDWEAVSGADGMVVKLYNAALTTSIDTENTLLFTSAALTPATVTISFGTSDYGWLSSTKAVVGEDYLIAVEAFKFEASVPQIERGFNVEMISVAKKEITWGE
jgi:hypothetical protein